MSGYKNNFSHRRKLVNLIVMFYCIAIAVCVFSVLIFVFNPNLNSPGALGSTCMDTVCIGIVMIMVLSFVFEKDAMSTTTKLFMGLMLGTLWALIFDFLTWSLDGALVYDGWTYVFTVASLCSGAILGGIFVLYLSNYMDEMYDIKSAHLSAKICAICNVVAFVLTLALAFSKDAFVFVDGHYQTGALYDVITVIPVLTLIYMTVFAVCHVKTMGAHDVIAVVIYILIMITGALLEATFGFGATYVSISIADVFIFVMLQNKVIDRDKKQKAIMTEKIASQYEILESMAGIYSYVDYVDIEGKSVRRFDMSDSISEKLDLNVEPHTGINRSMYEYIEDDMKDKFWEYTNLSTLAERMESEKIITAEFIHKNDGWFRAQYIRIGDSVDEPIKKVIYAIRNIDEEKKNVEKWIRKSNTDEVTGFYNRHAYEDEITELEGNIIEDNFVYVSMDVNELKIVNDTRGHNAGDELITGACECMRRCFGTYGKLFRTGGDEFAALIYVDNSKLDELIEQFEKYTLNWSGKLVSALAVSYGYVTRTEAKGMSIRQIAILADKKMYENKTEYYRKKGLDRRGQKDAHVALCALYTKILKINVTDDTYQIENMNIEEQNAEHGFADTLSGWLKGFADSLYVHPDDVEDFKAATDIKNISEYFKHNNKLFRLFYKRKENDEYKSVMMEIIPANDYRDDSQNLYLYVKNIGDFPL